MKIKSKLIAGGLMTTVACALVGSITGTFAWIQYSNNATASMHGISVQTNQILQLKLDGTGKTWFSGNLVWNDTTKPNQSIATLFDANKKDADSNFKLTPVSNGANDGTEGLASTWFGNPDGVSANLPVAQSGYMQFAFYARLAESDGTTTTYPDGNLYVTDIASKLWGDDNDKISFSLRMHVQLGEGQNAQSFVVNPTKAVGETVELKADYAKKTVYDFETKVGETIHYQLPQERYTAASAETENTTNRGALKAGVDLTATQAEAYNIAIQPQVNKAENDTLNDTEAAAYNATLQNLVSEGQFVEDAGNLVALPFNTKGGVNDIMPNVAANGALTGGKFVAITGAANEADAVGVKITVTVWLEGFANDPSTIVNYTQTEADAYNAAHNLTQGDDGFVTTATPNPASISNWWDFDATIGRQIAAGLELTGIKA